MSREFSIFKIIDGVPHWVETVATFEVARLRADGLVALCPSEYVIFDTSTEDITWIKPRVPVAVAVPEAVALSPAR